MMITPDECVFAVLCGACTLLVCACVSRSLPLCEVRVGLVWSLLLLLNRVNATLWWSSTNIIMIACMCDYPKSSLCATKQGAQSLMMIAQCLIEYNHYCNKNDIHTECVQCTHIYRSIMAYNKHLHLHVNALEMSVSSGELATVTVLWLLWQGRRTKVKRRWRMSKGVNRILLLCRPITTEIHTSHIQFHIHIDIGIGIAMYRLFYIVSQECEAKQSVTRCRFEV